MADKKISALTAATTPLDGTEVLPIVQSGATKKVANNDLRPRQIQSNATSGVLQIVGPAAAATRVMTTPDANFTAARTDAANSFSGNQTLSDGNLVVGTAGKGIDFSANSHAAGMTSELLTWYEEGTFNATISDGTTSATMSSLKKCAYTRIGRQVTVTGYVATSDMTGVTGSLRLEGLPFTVANANEFHGGGTATYGSGLSIAAGNSLTLVPIPNSTYCALFLWDTATGTSAMAGTEWSNVGEITFSLTYFSA